MPECAIWLIVWQDPEDPELYRGPAQVRGRPAAVPDCATEALRSLAVWQQLAGPGGRVVALSCQNQERTRI